jgi:hypothetical protein
LTATKFLVIVAVVVVVAPIAVSVPLMFVFVPPTVSGRPTALTLLMQLVSPVLGLVAMNAVMLDGFVKVMVDFGDAFLAIIVSVHERDSDGEREKSCEHGGYERSFATKRND